MFHIRRRQRQAVFRSRRADKGVGKHDAVFQGVLFHIGTTVPKQLEQYQLVRELRFQ